MRRITILGATGSIGQSTIDLIARDPDAYAVEALTGGHNITQLAQDAIRLNAKLAVTAHPGRLEDLREALSGTGIEAAAGPQALIEAAERPADWVMSAIIGAAGLAPGLAALRKGATLALANKESLVCAGRLMLSEAEAHNARMLPVDSEHSALFQALAGEDMASVERVIITASGGAFRDWPIEALSQATPEQASTHPNWAMGQRITIDSASMFNKALELIEAREFFHLDPDQIEVLVHPESLIHAMVGHVDGGLLAHVGPADMRHAIGYALNWPERAPLPVERLDFAKIAQLTFRAPDPVRYPALEIAQRVMRRGGLSGAVMNAAKEEAMDAFIDRRIGFNDMARTVSRVLDRAEGDPSLLDADFTLDNVLGADQMGRSWARDDLPAVTGTGTA
ncbi:1-deoxy-D-xylulose-5-phosphate reductoisomerase [Pseudooceanicola sp. CBS1P-1]|uniref:1-deoxy-D-xylulose 5-phosphate reductoisomerase n=1 Tax=Pseudooceanicola albus TaxID=2692189 RepID=A0A6L7FZ11_9RHOB|nr:MULTISPECIES: 1-deoxy-D-xylulose-5-phosphate reductoisomerase [Pseudooceanicola]MBT9383179.1 1-deoxy-D-xylulose-5-phosphate reductoisomerase [Pseudooceanicola endophyticus]MXN16498.1 1-deoxy-D-xylulose-5-phosphate reductoisomerase [Pseudooceanicola albus]